MSKVDKPGNVGPGAVPDDEAVTNVFDLLSSEGRLAILWTLWEAIEPGEEQTPISFTDLANRCAYDSPGNLSYHLDKLVGEYVHKTDAGYLLTGTGQKLIAAVRAGAMTRNVEFGPFEINERCPYCSGKVKASYADNYIQARCTTCGGTYPGGGMGVLDHHPPGPIGVITHCEFPPAGVASRDPAESLRTFLSRIAFQAFSMLADACPECAGEVAVTTSVCTDHPDDDGGCASCGFRYPAQTILACQYCKLQIISATRWLTLSDPRVAAFFQERGMETRSGFSMELWDVMDDADHHVRATDPVDIRFTFQLGDDTLEVDVHGSLSGIDVIA